ncbi:MAG: thioredoxin [Candidatus Bathyarchaeota archaeon B23]|nr:MAG: thioredoxin [Candidatus Bathyarchaeota archaeon B23]
MDEELRRLKMKKMMELLRGRGRGERPGESMAPSRPLELTDADFQSVVEGNPLVVVDCWAPWCGPCLYVAPIIEELARDYAGRIVFGKLNVDENPQTAVRYRIMSIPTLLVFKDGKLVDRIVGAMPRRRLETLITRYL